MHRALSQRTTVFQAEVFAIDLCVGENLRRKYEGAKTTLYLTLSGIESHRIAISQKNHKLWLTKILMAMRG